MKKKKKEKERTKKKSYSLTDYEKNSQQHFSVDRPVNLVSLQKNFLLLLLFSTITHTHTQKRKDLPKSPPEKQKVACLLTTNIITNIVLPSSLTLLLADISYPPR